MLTPLGIPVYFTSALAPVFAFGFLVLAASIVLVTWHRETRANIVMMSSPRHAHKFSRADRQYADETRWGTWRRGLKQYSIVLLVGYLALNVLTAMISPINAPAANSGSYTKAAAQLGLKEDQAYPLVIGGMAISSTGTAHTSSNLFTVRTGVDLRPTPVFVISFTHDGYTEVLIVPGDRMRIYQVPGADPTVKVAFEGGKYDTSIIQKERDEYGDFRPRYYSPWDQSTTRCKWGLVDLAIGCVRERTRLGILSDKGREAGLSPLGPHIEKVRITVSPEMYRDIIGAK